MAKKVSAYIKLQVPAGQANPSPPVGPALGQHGVNIMEFCKAFNSKTQSMESGMPIPVIITVYGDRSFTFITKTPPAAAMSRVLNWKKLPRPRIRILPQQIWMQRSGLLPARPAAWVSLLRGLSNVQDR